MAEKNLLSDLHPKMVSVPYLEIGWIPSRNSSRPEGIDIKTKESVTLTGSLARSGWLSNQVCEIQKATPDLIKAWTEYVTNFLKAQFELSSKSDEAKAAYEAYQSRFTVVKDGEQVVRVPKYIGITCNRRDACMVPAAILAAKESGVTVSSFLEDLVLTCHVYDKLDPIQVVAIQSRENNKVEGNTEMSHRGILHSAFLLRTAGITISTLRSLFGDGIGQKAGYVMDIALRFPNLDLYSEPVSKPAHGRLIDPANENPKFITWSKLRHGELPSLLRRASPEDLSAWNTKQTAKGVPADQLETPIDEAGIDAYFETLMGRSSASSTTKTKGMSPNQMATLSQNNKVANPVIASVVDAVRTNDATKLSEVTARSVGLSALMKMPNVPVLYGALDVLSRLTEDDRTAAIAEIERIINGYRPAPITPEMSSEMAVA